VADKIQKNLFCSQVYNFIRPVKTVIESRYDDKRVIGLPSRSGRRRRCSVDQPHLTAIYKILIALKARCISS
jgi:hypothetical protein